MNRDESWPIADISTSLMDDPKIKALARALRDPRATAAAVTLYQAAVLASWREGTRVTIDAAQPAWWTDPADDLVAALVAVDLIDGTTRTIPLRTWRSWYFPAAKRRRAIRRKQSLGGLMAHGASLDTALAELNRRDAEWLAHLEELEPAWEAEYFERESLKARLLSSTSTSDFLPSLPTYPSPARRIGSGDPTTTDEVAGEAHVGAILDDLRSKYGKSPKATP